MSIPRANILSVNLIGHIQPINLGELMRSILFLLLLIPLAALADDPVAPVAAPAIVASKDVTGTGTRSDPFVFDSKVKPLLRIVGAPEPVEWDTKNCPTDTEAIGNVLIFSLSEPGEYITYAGFGTKHETAWFVIKSGTDPPKPEDPAAGLSRRVKTALAGNPQDAVKFAAVMDSLNEALPTINRLGEFESKMAKGLTAVNWPVGAYPDLSRLAGDLFGKQVADRALTAEDRAEFAASLKALSAACKAVK